MVFGKFGLPGPSGTGIFCHFPYTMSVLFWPRICFCYCFFSSEAVLLITENQCHMIVLLWRYHYEMLACIMTADGGTSRKYITWLHGKLSFGIFLEHVFAPQTSVSSNFGNLPFYLNDFLNFFESIIPLFMLFAQCVMPLTSKWTNF